MRKIARVRILLEYEDGSERTFLDARAPNIGDVVLETDVVTEYPAGSLIPTKKPGPNITATIKVRKPVQRTASES